MLILEDQDFKKKMIRFYLTKKKSLEEPELKDKIWWKLRPKEHKWEDNSSKHKLQMNLKLLKLIIPWLWKGLSKKHKKPKRELQIEKHVWKLRFNIKKQPLNKLSEEERFRLKLLLKRLQIINNLKELELKQKLGLPRLHKTKLWIDLEFLDNWKPKEL